MYNLKIKEMPTKSGYYLCIVEVELTYKTHEYTPMILKYNTPAIDAFSDGFYDPAYYGGEDSLADIGTIIAWQPIEPFSPDPIEYVPFGIATKY